VAFGQRVLEGSGLGPDACDFMFGNPQEPSHGAKQNCIGFVECCCAKVMTTVSGANFDLQRGRRQYLLSGGGSSPQRPTGGRERDVGP